MKIFQTRTISEDPDTIAPDGSDVRFLVATERASMAHFELAVGETTKAVVHKTVEELWFITGGEGEMWRKNEAGEEITTLRPGLSLTILTGTHFQFRNTGEDDPLEAVATTIPPWPGADESVAVEGKWK